METPKTIKIFNRRSSMTVQGKKNSGHRPTRMQLFQEDASYDEMDLFNVFTPGKQQAEGSLGATPTIRKALSDLFLDEDSGIGMENDSDSQAIKFTETVTDVTKSDTALVSGSLGFQIRRPFASLSDTPTSGSAFMNSKTKRPLLNSGNTDSPMKRFRRAEQSIPKRIAPKLRKTLSYGDEPRRNDVQTIVDRLAEEEDLISDGSSTYRLPTITGKHRDLKNISNYTMTDLLNGKFDDNIADYKIIDCRYPYEYQGGHVKGAVNIYTHEGIAEFLERENKTKESDKRTILIFYCEFSSERGPKMCRYLREKDRELNSENYPALNYPETYLMYGGYKDFYNNHKTSCEPMEYKPMLHADHSEELRHFRSKSKSWSAAEKKRKGSRLRF